MSAMEKESMTPVAVGSKSLPLPQPPPPPPPPHPSELVVTITQLNLYADLSEVSGLVLCPGFKRSNSSSTNSRLKSDPVPSHQHPESISPTLLPPIPTIEQRQQAVDAANQQNAIDQERMVQRTNSQHAAMTGSGEMSGGDGLGQPVGKLHQPAAVPIANNLAEFDAPTPPVTNSIAAKLKFSLHRLTGTSTAVPTTPPSNLPLTVSTVPTTPVTKASTVTTQTPATISSGSNPTLSNPVMTIGTSTTNPPSSSTNWLTTYFKRRTPAASSTGLSVPLTTSSGSTTLDSISPPQVIASTKLGDTDQEMDLRPTSSNGTTPTSSTTAAVAQKRTNSIMQQLWLATSTESTSNKKAKLVQKKEHEPDQSPSQPMEIDAPVVDSSTSSTTDSSQLNPSSGVSHPPPTVASRISSFVRSSIDSAASLAAATAYWTLGPFQSYPINEPSSTTTTSSTTKTPSILPPPEPPIWSTMRKVVIIGVHGWSLMGGLLSDRPIVVSNKFCQMTERALAQFCHDHGVPLEQIQVCNIPLHGHGKVEQRIEEYLNHQLPSFRPFIQTADVILVVAHSQGVLVSVSLLHQLILRGWIDPSKRHVSMQLMAGLHHGPYPDLLWDLYAATKELFAYCYVESDVHRRYMEALHYLLEHSVKILCLGSAHDQAVPLYSSLLQSFPSTPNLLRGIYIDYSTYQPDFLHALLSLIVFLMNTGIHGRRSSDSPDLSHVYIEALVHMSGFLRGGILEKNGGAHSAIHRLTDCYNLGIEWSLCGRGVDTPVYVHSHSFALWAPYFQESFTQSKMNRYLMAVRFRELFSLLPRTQLDAKQELIRLYQLYTLWQPRTKPLLKLKEALQPIFELPQTPTTTTRISTPTNEIKEAGEEEKKSHTMDESSASSTTNSIDSSGSASSFETSLLTLLTPPRLSHLPVPYPSSWSAPNHDPTSSSSTYPTDTLITSTTAPAPTHTNNHAHHTKRTGKRSRSPSPLPPSLPPPTIESSSFPSATHAIGLPSPEDDLETIPSTSPHK